jgi:hypothetical protein
MSVHDDEQPGGERPDEHSNPSTEPDGQGFGLPRPSRTLTALTSSALALPGIAGSARADGPVEKAQSSSSFSYYMEDNLSPGKFSGVGSRNRYEVYTFQTRFDVPTSERTDVGVEFLYEDMSGASPWFVTVDPDPNARGKRLQVMSGATIEDERIDLAADIDFFVDNGKDSFRAGFSKEKDYLSINGGLGTERSFFDKNTTFSFSGGFSHDWIEPTDANKFQTRPDDETKWSIDLFTGLSQILTRSTVGQVTINYKHSDGYLSDPYKAITDLSNAGVFSDERPDTKDQVSILFRLRQHVEPITASIHADYRFYHDDWDITSHTFELAWYQQITEWFRIIPSARYYSQSQADFYDTILPQIPVGARPPSERSSDFRLSPYGAISWRFKAEVELNDVAQYDPPPWLEAVGVTGGLDLIASASWERYLSDGDFALISVSDRDEAPGLVDFHVFAFTLTGRF